MNSDLVKVLAKTIMVGVRNLPLGLKCDVGDFFFRHHHQASRHPLRKYRYIVHRLYYATTNSGLTHGIRTTCMRRLVLIGPTCDEWSSWRRGVANAAGPLQERRAR